MSEFSSLLACRFHFLRARRGYLCVDMHTLVPSHTFTPASHTPRGSVVGLATHAKTQTSRGVAAATFSLPQHTSSQAISPQRCPPTPRRPPSPPTGRLDAGDLPSCRQLAGGERQGGGGTPGASRLVETPACSRHPRCTPRFCGAAGRRGYIGGVALVGRTGCPPEVPVCGWARGVVPREGRGGVTAGWCAAGAAKLMTGGLCGSRPIVPPRVHWKPIRVFFFLVFFFRRMEIWLKDRSK